MKKSIAGSNMNIFNRACYQLAWRWHFYAGLFVIPFLMVLSITGTVMLYDKQIQSLRYDYSLTLEDLNSKVLPASKLVASVQGVYSTAVVKKFIPAKTKNDASFVVIKQNKQTLHIAINPYTGELLANINRDQSIYAWANDIHGTLLLGETGDYLMEVAAGLMILLLISGLYMWLPSNNSSKRAVFWPKKSNGKRVFYRELHSALGFYSAIILLFFVISGLAWTGVWGSKVVQPWSSFPMVKSKSVPLSTKPHSILNQGVMEEVPWNLEQTLLPESTPVVSDKTPVVDVVAEFGVDQVTAIAATLAMDQYQVRYPLSERAVFTLSASTMSGDISNPQLDRTVHIDRYSGKVLADIGWDDYSPMAKFMAAGIGLHQGGLGIINLVVNTLICMVMMIVSITALIMWWARKPNKGFSLNAPVLINNSPNWKLGIIVILFVGVLFPLSGAAIVLFVCIDLLIKISLTVRDKIQLRQS